MVTTAGPDGDEAALERSLLTGIVAFEWVAGIWAAVALGIDLAQAANAPGSDAGRISLAHPGPAAALVAAALAFTAWSTVTVRTQAARLLQPIARTVHGTLALALVFLDEWAYGPHNFHSQSLGSIWPFTWVFVMGVAAAGRIGFAAGTAVGTTAWLGALRFGELSWTGDEVMGAWGTVVLYALGGAVTGFAAIKLREAEREVALARAREEVGRTLHDGVLQTLAVIQRRSTDEELVRLARDQETELREFLFGARRERRTLGARRRGPDLLAELRAAAALVERRDGLRAEVVAVTEPAAPGDAVVAALKGAVAEALTNAAKHGHATRATVYVDQDDDGGIFCSVKDDGEGFDPAATDEGTGLTTSVRGRLADVGGSVEIDSRPGAGAEVRMRV